MNGRMLSRAIQSTSPSDDRGPDEDGDARRKRHEPSARRGRPEGSMNGGGGSAAAQSGQRVRGTVGDGGRGLVHRAADYQTWNAPRPCRADAASDRAVPAPPARQRWRLVARARRRPAGLGGRELARRLGGGPRGDRAAAASGRADGLGRGLRSGRRCRRDRGRARARRHRPDRASPGWRVREALGGRLPEGWRLVDVYDVWLGDAGAGRPGRRGGLSDRSRAVDVAAVDGGGRGALAAARALPAPAAEGRHARRPTTCVRS